MSASLPDLDRIDLKILNALQQDGRISNLKLAETVMLSPTAVLARVQRLTKDGYIMGYEARLNPHGRYGGISRICGHRAVAIARGARDTNLCSDGRGEELYPPATAVMCCDVMWGLLQGCAFSARQRGPCPP